MNVGEFFAHLSYGELCNLAIGMEGAGTISEREQSRVISYTNRALTLLYSRFAHKTNYVKLRMVDGRKSYPLRNLHAVTNVTVGNTADRFLIDTAQEPFVGNLVKVVSVYTVPGSAPDSDADEANEDPEEVQINDASAAVRVKLLSFDTLYFDEVVAGQEYIIEYQENHARLSSPAEMSEEIVLAPVLEEALSLKVAAKIFSSMNGQENMAKSMALESEFERILAMIAEEDLLQETTSDDHDKLPMRGWI